MLRVQRFRQGTMKCSQPVKRTDVEAALLNILLALLLASAIAAAPLHHLVEDKRVLDFMSDVLVRATLSNDFAESAAFLVRDTRGDIQCLMWPPTNAYQKQVFNGAVPPRTIAIVHTHPTFRATPSLQDIKQAKQLGLPLFILTRNFVTAVDGGGTTIALIERHYWPNADVREKCVERWFTR